MRPPAQVALPRSDQPTAWVHQGCQAVSEASRPGNDGGGARRCVVPFTITADLGPAVVRPVTDDRRLHGAHRGTRVCHALAIALPALGPGFVSLQAMISGV